MIPAPLTPFTEQGRIDMGLLEKQISYLVEAGANGLFIAGTTGEGAFLSTAEKAEVLKAARRVAGGRAFLQFLQLSETSLAIAGGIILFLIALRMVFHHPEGIFGDAPDTEPFLVPLAVPAIAGPSAIATVMLMASRDPSRIAGWFVALSAAMAVTTIVLLAGNQVQRVLGERGVRALERLMGLVLTAIAVQMLLNGVADFVRQLATSH